MINSLLGARFERLVPSLLAMPRMAKRGVVVLVDTSLCVFSVWLAYYLRLGEFIGFSSHAQWGDGASRAALVSVGLALPLFMVSGLYRAIFRYSGWLALIAVARAVAIYALAYASLFTVVGVAGVPRTVGIIQPILLLLLVGSSRVLARLWLSSEYQSGLRRNARPRALIYGAGETGRQLAAAMANSPELQVVGFIDDDHRLQRQLLNGQPIYNPADLGSLVESLGITDVLLAMPNVPRQRRNAILAEIRGLHVVVRTLPSLTDLAKGRVSVSDLRELDVDDLLGREPVLPRLDLLSKKVTGKVVMVTGAGGSIGGELCRQILALAPSRLLLLEQNEFALYCIHQELTESLLAADASTDLSLDESLSSHSDHLVARMDGAADTNCARAILVPLLASVQDRVRINEIVAAWRPQTVYHAAAYKHVPLVEHNPAAGIKNNLYGTLRVAQAALAHGVGDFVMVSTDKAVRPTSVMGASKRLAEMVLQALAATSQSTRFSIVRFGNVLGSSGSVVPRFRQQIRSGGPITLTHPEVTRYFMTIPEAAQLVVQASAMAKGGDVFVLDMGEPVRIIDLARRMVELSGLSIRDEQNPEGDIEIQISGLRPGEKLYEELLIGDNPRRTEHPRIMEAQEEFISWPTLEPELLHLESSVNRNDAEAIRDALERLVTGYCPTREILDLTFIERPDLL